MTSEQFIARLIEQSNATAITSSKHELQALFELSHEYVCSRQENNAANDLIELIGKIPALITFLRFNQDSDQDKEAFCQAMTNYCAPDKSFPFESESPLFKAYLERVSVVPRKDWIDDHAAFFNEDLLFKLPKTHEARLLLIDTAHLFAENANNAAKVVIEIHKFFLKNNGEHLYVPDCIGATLQQYVNKEVFDTFRSYIDEGALFYYSPYHRYPFGKTEITCHKMFDKFYSQHEVTAFAEDALSRGAHACISILRRFHQALTVEQVQALLNLIIIESYIKKSHSNYFKSVKQEIVDVHAEFCLDISPWCYIHLSEEARTRLLHKVNFETHLGLLIAHPLPNQVDSELWKKAITEHEITYSKFPEHLVFGNKALTEDEWFDLIQSVKGGNNKIFKALVKHYKEFITESLLNKVATLEGTTAANHKIVVSHVAKLAHEKRENAEFEKILEIIDSGDVAKIANKIQFMMNKGMGSNRMLERIVVAIKESGKAA